MADAQQLFFGGHPAVLQALVQQPGTGWLADLFRASHLIRSSVLQLAPSGALRLSLGSGIALEPLQRRLKSARRDLLLRGSALPTALQLQIKESTVSAACLDAVAPALHGAGAGVTALTVEFPYASQRTTTDVTYGELLTQTLAAVPNLHSLSLAECRSPLPTNVHELLPSLTQFSYSGQHCDPDLCASVGPLLPQLTSLSFGARSYNAAPSWARVFAPATTTHTLTHLTVKCLDDTLLSLLLTHAPALQVIHTVFIGLSETYRDEQWGLRELYVGGWSIVDSLPHLPRNVTRVVCFPDVEEMCFELEDSQYEQADFRLSEWSFPLLETVRILTDTEADTDADAAAITNILAQLHHLQAPRAAVLEWCNSQWSPELVQLVAAAAPHAPSCLRHTVCVGELTDEQLGVLLGLGPLVRVLEVDSVQLVDYDHVDTPWPWEELHILSPYDPKTNLGVLLQLPDPSTCHAPPLIRYHDISFHDVPEGDAALLRDWLGHVRWSGPVSVSLHGHKERWSDLDLSRELSLVRALRFSDADPSVSLHHSHVRGEHLTVQHLASMLATAATSLVCSSIDIKPLIQAQVEEVQDWLRQVAPGRAPLVIECNGILMQTISQADAELVTALLQHVRFKECDGVDMVSYKYSTEAYQHAPGSIAAQEASLQAAVTQMDVLRALQCVPGTEPEAMFRVSQDLLASAAMHHLASLPDWVTKVALSQCTFEESRAAEYAQLAQHIPLRITRWELGRVPSAVLQSICDGINHCREGMGLRPVTVQARGSEFHEVVAGEHVELEVGPF